MSMRRGVGVAGIKKDQLQKAKFKEKGTEVDSMRMEQMQERLSFFKDNLAEFAQKHKKDINKNPVFRYHFSQMCAKIGVDPLASSKGFWAELLGVGDFYYELGVQIIDICLKTRNQNGGLIELQELLQRVCKIRSSKKNTQEISKEDILQAIQNLKHLGNSFRVIKLSEQQILVQSVPCELSGDHTAILAMAQGEKKGLTRQQVSSKLNWTMDRVESALNLLLQEGFAWIDEHEKETYYWFPSLSLASV